MSDQTTNQTPTHFLLVLFPCFQLLDVAGPLDILNLLSITHPPASSITLTIVASTLDPVPIKPIPPIDPLTSKPKWTYSGLPETTNLSFTQSLTPTTTFSSYLSAVSSSTTSPFPGTPSHPPIDVLLIPGGVGTRLTRHHPDGTSTSNISDLVSFTTAIHTHIRHSIITVCTGSAALSQTTLLNTRRATTNMSRFDDVASAQPQVHWLKGRRWVRSRPDPSSTFQREIWSSAGISAGIDVTLAFVAEFFGGIDVARTAARRLEYEWREIPEGAVDPLYELAPGDLGEWDE